MLKIQREHKRPSLYKIKFNVRWNLTCDMYLNIGVFDPSFYTADILQLNATEYAYLVVFNAKQSGKFWGFFTIHTR